MSKCKTLHLLWLFISSFPSLLSLQTNDTDYAALMAFKSHLLLQPDSILSTNWTPTSHFCNWFGVSCSNQRVTKLHLSGLGLAGELSPYVGNITHLIELDLSANELGGSLPPELGILQQLRILNLTKNSLQGSIPSNLSRCENLEELDLSYNLIGGSIPQDLGLLSNLHHLALDHNNLTGDIPSSLGNFSKLGYFYLHENDLFGGIPVELGRLRKLLVIGLRGNSLTGLIPPSIFNLSSLQIVDISVNRLSGWLPESLGENLPNLERLFLDSNRITGKIPVFLCNASMLSYLFFTENDLQGEIPGELGRLQNLLWFEFEYNRISGGVPYSLFNVTSLEIVKARHNYLTGELPRDLGNWLPNLREMFLSHNLFTGSIPPSICNATELVYLEVANNSFSGPVPMMLGKLAHLEHLNLQNNFLVSSINPLSDRLDFLDSLVNSRNLQFLILESNPLSGVLPESVGNLSRKLKVFTAISCELKGGIPHGIGNLSGLNYLGLSRNSLRGEVPLSFSRLRNLERVYLTGNIFEGSIPAVFCSIKMLGILHLGENMFSGSIPACIRNLTELREVSMAANTLNSTIPVGFWDLVKVEGLNLSKNHLHGTLPMELGNLKAINIMDLSWNSFSGEIPSSAGNLQNLLTLDMSQNKFGGPIPNSLSNLIVIEYLDLSSNSLSGSIPASLGSLRDLVYLNLSFNMLQGEIPVTGVFRNITPQSLMGNPKLCGAPELSFPSCPSRKRKSKFLLVVKITVPISVAVLLILLGIIFARKKEVSRDQMRMDPIRIGHQFFTYSELVRATDAFNESNLIGQGSSGKVYKGRLPDSTFVAIKVFNMEYSRALKNFDAECEVLSNVRHRNIVKIISTCSNLDFKAMILKFMPNGSLDKWLHSATTSLTLVQRLDVVSDVATAMEYLHHEYVVPIVHCDLKPSNVLLDGDMVARVADFGIAKILSRDDALTRTNALGTIGYIAPEYGLDGQVSRRGDVYSFGILLLETLTGKRPTDDMFGEELSLHQWVRKSFPGALTEILDSSLFDDLEPVKESSSSNLIELVLKPVVHLAFLCLKDIPEDRIDMRGIVQHLKKLGALLKNIYTK